MLDFDIMAWVVIPILVFLARLLDVSLATVRQIFIFKGIRFWVPVIAFVEVLIWLIAITQVMQNLSNVAGYLGWAFGFAAGSYYGMVIEEKMALGHQLVRIITHDKAEHLLKALADANFRYTLVPAKGSRGPVEILFVAVERKQLGRLIGLIKDCAPNLFYTVEDVRSVAAGGAVPGVNPPLARKTVWKGLKRK